MGGWAQQGGWAQPGPGSQQGEATSAGIYAIISGPADANSPRSSAALSVRFNTQADGLGDDYSIDSLTWTAVDPGGDDASAAIDDATAATTTIDESTVHQPGQWSASVTAVIGGVTQPAVEVSWTLGVEGWFVLTPSDWTRENGTEGDCVTDNGNGTFTLASGVVGASFDKMPWWIGPEPKSNHHYEFFLGFVGGNIGGKAVIGAGICDQNHAGANPMVAAMLYNLGQAAVRNFTSYIDGILVDANVDAVIHGLNWTGTAIRAPTLQGINEAGWPVDEASGFDHNVTPDGTAKLFIGIGPNSPASDEDIEPWFRWRGTPIPDLTP